MILEPLQDRVVVKMTDVEETTKSGLILSSASKEKPQFAEVIAVGPEVKIKVKQGDRVITTKFAGTEVKVGDDIQIIVKQADILAVVK